MKKFLLICISVMTFFAMSLTAFASTAPEFVPQDGYDFFQYQLSNGENKVYMWQHSNEAKVQVNPSDGGIIFSNVPNGTTIYQYYYSNSKWKINSDWEHTINGIGSNYGTYSLVLGDYNFTYSSFNIYSTEGGLVFRPTPPLEEVVAEEMQKFQTTTNQTVSIVVLCGVGCLALLIGCHLLRKKSVLFLNR